MPFDLNKAKPQRKLELIPKGSIVTLEAHPVPNTSGEYVQPSKDGKSFGVNFEHTVIAPEDYATLPDGDPRKIYERLTLGGETQGQQKAGEISQTRIRAIVESACGLNPHDTSEATNKVRDQYRDFPDLDGLRFLARVGEQGAQGQYRAKNFIDEVITPDDKAWKRVEQPPKVSPPPFDGKSAAPPPQSSPPAGSIARPDWAK